MDPKDLIETFGTLGLLFIIFAESGLLLGLVFPGDSLLFTAGLLASQGKLNIAAVVLEPIQGEGGFIVPGAGFVPALRDYCLQNGIAFVADEVQTGIGRTGRWFGIEHEDVVPDLTCPAAT